MYVQFTAIDDHQGHYWAFHGLKSEQAKTFQTPHARLLTYSNSIMFGSIPPPNPTRLFPLHTTSNTYIPLNYYLLSFTQALTSLYKQQLLVALTRRGRKPQTFLLPRLLPQHQATTPQGPGGTSRPSSTATSCVTLHRPATVTSSNTGRDNKAERKKL